MKNERATLPQQETLFETICRLAKAKDEEKLADLFEGHQNYFISSYYGFDSSHGYYATPEWLLAKEGHSEAVDFLIEKFEVSRDFAAQGYAAGGHVEQVNALLAQGADKGYVVWGYAQGGHVAQVNELIDLGADPTYALLGYEGAGYVNQVGILRLMALTDNEKLRERLADKVKEENQSLDVSTLLIKARKLNLFMKENNLSFEQAISYLALFSPAEKESIKDGLVWEREGQQLVEQGIIPEEINSRILSYVTSSSERDNRHIFAAVEKEDYYFSQRKEQLKHKKISVDSPFLIVM